MIFHTVPSWRFGRALFLETVSNLFPPQQIGLFGHFRAAGSFCTGLRSEGDLFITHCKGGVREKSTRANLPQHFFFFFSSGEKVASLFREWSSLSDRAAGTCCLVLWLLLPAGPELFGVGGLCCPAF